MTESRPDPGVGAFAEILGARRTVMGDGRCCFEVTAQRQHLNPHGVVHGGVLYSLVDYAMGGAVVSRLDAGERCATLEIKINYLRAVTGGRLVAEAMVLTRTRRVAVVEARVRDDAGELVAVATGSFYVRDTTQEAAWR